jgi:hypothetical protein
MTIVVNPNESRTIRIPDANGITILLPNKNRNHAKLVALFFFAIGSLFLSVLVKQLVDAFANEGVEWNLHFMFITGIQLFLGSAMYLCALNILTGVERIQVNSKTLTTTTKWFVFGKQFQYDMQHVKNLRVATRIMRGNISTSNDPGGARLSHQFVLTFDYGNKGCDILSNVDEPELNRIAKDLIARYPSLAPTSQG